MKTTKRLLMITGSILLSAALSSIISQAQEQNSIDGNLYSATSQTRHITPLRSKGVPEGSCVTINADSPLSDAVSYKSGDRFVVVIPQADISSVQSDLQGRGFVDSQ